MDLILKVAKILNLEPITEDKWNRKFNIQINSPDGPKTLISALDNVLRVTLAKSKSKELGFICLFTDGNGTYWFKVSRGFSTALHESLASLETLIDETADLLTPDQKEKVNALYRVLNSLYD